jgi:hypothetical protein
VVVALVPVGAGEEDVDAGGPLRLPSSLVGFRRCWEDAETVRDEGSRKGPRIRNHIHPCPYSYDHAPIA